jgi:hypothetical protein
MGGGAGRSGAEDGETTTFLLRDAKMSGARKRDPALAPVKN